MKQLLPALAGILFFFSGCVKANTECTHNDSSVSASAAERTDVRNYLNANSITAVEHNSGLFYKIVSPGTGASISNLCSEVRVSYTGTLTNGTVFDSTPTGQSVSFPLYGVIVGWQKSIPLINAGGSINLYIPPSLAYGSQVVRDGSGNVLIPANSILIFQVSLVSVMNL